MCPQVDVIFVRRPDDPSVESSVQRWVDRLTWMKVDVQRASVRIVRSGWRRTSVYLTLVEVGGRALATTYSHADVYVAVAQVFREARKQVLLGRAAARVDRSFAIGG
jgi:hypothetical protein